MMRPTAKIEPVRTTGRNITKDFANEYAKRARAKAALGSTSWHNDMLVLSESIIADHAVELIARRRQLTVPSNDGLDNPRWLQEVDFFIDEVIEKSGGTVKHCPELLRAIKWMIAGATAQFASAEAPFLSESKSAVVANAA